MKISCVNLPLLDWSLSSVLLVDIWLPVAHPGEAEGRSQSQAVGVGGRWDSSLQISTLFTCFLNDRTVGQTNEELSHRKLLWMCLFCVFSEWLYPLQYAYMKSSWLTTVLFISFQSAPERDQRAGDPVPDRALLQGERWGTGSQSMSVNYWTLFPFLSFSTWIIRSLFDLVFPQVTKENKVLKRKSQMLMPLIAELPENLPDVTFDPAVNGDEVDGDKVDGAGGSSSEEMLLLESQAKITG